MRVYLFDNSIGVSDTNFYFECYKPKNIIDIQGVKEFDIENGTLDLNTSNGNLFLMWDVDRYKNAVFDINNLEIINMMTEGDFMHILIDGLQLDSSRKGERSYVHVKDLKNPKNCAEVIIDRLGTVRVLNSTFSVNSKRRWQLLYYIEANKQQLYDGD